MNNGIHPDSEHCTPHTHTGKPYLNVKGEDLLLDTSVERWSISVCQGKKYLQIITHFNIKCIKHCL